MATGNQSPPDDPRTSLRRSAREESFGCFILVLVCIVIVAAFKLFEMVGPAGSLGAGIASFGLAAMAFGIIWVVSKYWR